MQITAEIKSIDTKIADNYMCKLGNSNWGQSVSVTTTVHLFNNPGRTLLYVRLENVDMRKVLYQDALLDVAQIVITIAPAQ